jgi:hypothetical protein
MQDQTPPSTDELFVLGIPLPEPRLFLLSDEGQTIIQVFISPVDAVMESLWLPLKPGTVEVVSSCFPFVQSFIKAHKSLSPTLHLAWQARARKLLRSSDGRLLPVTHGIILEPGESNITPSKASLIAFDLIREMAGLYAWRESAREFFRWEPQRQAQAMQRGRETVKAGIMGGSTEFDQLAVFDPEFMQWHFVPVADIAQALRAKSMYIKIKDRA